MPPKLKAAAIAFNSDEHSMKNPFTEIPELKRKKIVGLWLEANTIENEESAFDLMNYDDEWRMYPLGKIQELANIAGFSIELPDLDLGQIITSKSSTDNYETNWLNQIRNINELYIDIILDFLEIKNKKPD